MSVPPEVIRRMVALRRALHQHPELSHHEHASAGRICAALDELGVPYRAGVAGTGVIAELPGRQRGPFVALRADMDALPLTELTGLPFASQNPGVMHACGHDGHSAMVLGAAALLRAEPPPLPVRLLWQPAEELGTGALLMIGAGALDGVAAIFGGHVDTRYPAGALVVTEGAVNASTDGFRVLVQGRGGHGGRPHETTDALVVAAHLVLALQTVVSREVDPAHAAVLTVGRLVAGSAMNIIAETAQLEGTLRALDPAVRAQLCAAVPRVARAIAEAHGAGVEVALIDGTPPVINTPEMTALAREAAVQAVGAAQVTRLLGANMGGEDFGWYLGRVPGAFIRFGAGTEGRAPEPAHSPRFDLNERCLETGARWMAQVVRLAGERLIQGG